MNRNLYNDAYAVTLETYADAGKRIARILCLVEYELHIPNATTVGRNPAIWTSQTATVEVVRELIPNS